MSVLIAVPDKDLPPPIQELIDPTRPLPGHTTFVAYMGGIRLTNLILFWLIGAPGFLMLLTVVATPLPQIFGETPPVIPALIFSCVLAGLAAVGCYFVARWSWRMFAGRRAYARGLWRYGLFLHPSGLLVRLPGGTAFFPRSVVRGVTLADVKRHDLTISQLSLRWSEAGASHDETFPLTGDYALPTPEVAAQLQKWHNRH